MIKPTLRMYVDENGDYNLRGSFIDNSNRFLCSTGVIMRLSAHEMLEQCMNELKEQYFGAKDIVLHRRELISGKHPFEALKKKVLEITSIPIC